MEVVKSLRTEITHIVILVRAGRPASRLKGYAGVVISPVQRAALQLDHTVSCPTSLPAEHTITDRCLTS